MSNELEQTNELSVEEKARELRRAANRKSYRKHREKILEQRRLKRQEFHAEMLERERKYRAENPEKIKKWQDDYWKRKAEMEMDKEA